MEYAPLDDLIVCAASISVRPMLSCLKGNSGEWSRQQENLMGNDDVAHHPVDPDAGGKQEERQSHDHRGQDERRDDQREQRADIPQPLSSGHIGSRQRDRRGQQCRGRCNGQRMKQGDEPALFGKYGSMSAQRKLRGGKARSFCALNDTTLMTMTVRSGGAQRRM